MWDVIAKIGRCHVWSKVDLKLGFWYIEMDPESLYCKCKSAYQRFPGDGKVRARVRPFLLFCRDTVR